MRSTLLLTGKAGQPGRPNAVAGGPPSLQPTAPPCRQHQSVCPLHARCTHPINRGLEWALALLHAQRLYAVCRGTAQAALRHVQRGRRLCRTRPNWQARGVSGPGYAAGRCSRAAPGGEHGPRRPREALLPRRWDGQEAPGRSGYAANSVLLLLLTTTALYRGRVGVENVTVCCTICCGSSSTHLYVWLQGHRCSAALVAAANQHALLSTAPALSAASRLASGYGCAQRFRSACDIFLSACGIYQSILALLLYLPLLPPMVPTCGLAVVLPRSVLSCGAASVAAAATVDKFGYM